MNVDQQRYLEILSNAFHKQYGEQTDEWSRDPELRSFPAFIQGRLKLPANTRVLDIGCGAGFDTEYFARIFQNVVGIDLYTHPHWQTLQQQHTNITFCATAFLSYQTSLQFDLVLDNGCFHHQHPQQYLSYLQKVKKMLAANACYVISTFKNPSRDQHIDGNGRLHKYFADPELRELLEKGGFEATAEFDVYRAQKNDYYRLSFCLGSGETA